MQFGMWLGSVQLGQHPPSQDWGLNQSGCFRLSSLILAAGRSIKGKNFLLSFLCSPLFFFCFLRSPEGWQKPPHRSRKAENSADGRVSSPHCEEDRGRGPRSTYKLQQSKKMTNLLFLPKVRPYAQPTHKDARLPFMFSVKPAPEWTPTPLQKSQ